MDNIKHILDLFKLGSIKQVKDVPSSGNVLFDIETDQGRYFLRFNPSGGPRHRTKEEIHAEIEVLDLLKEKGIPVESAMECSQGNRVFEHEDAFGYLRKHIKGEYKNDPSADEVKKVGELLGKIHTATQDYQTTHERTHRWDLENAKHFLKEKTELIPLGVRARIEKEFGEMRFGEDLPSGMLHEDLGKRHVLWDQGEIVGVIDFDRMYHGPLVLDVGQAVRGWCFDEDWEELSEEKFEAFLNGYESVRKLTHEEKDVLFDALRFALLERAMSFIVRFAEMTQDPEDKKFAYDTMNLVGKKKST